MPEIFSGTFMSDKAFVARCGVDTLSRRFRGQSGRLTFLPIAAASASIIALLPAGCASRPRGLAAGRLFCGRSLPPPRRALVSPAARPDAWSGRYVYAEDPLPALSPSQCRPLSPRYADLLQTCSTMKRCEPAVLMHADIDKRAKVGDVGHRTFEDHTRLQVVHCLDAIGKLSGFKFRTRIATRFFQLFDDVSYCRHTEFSSVKSDAFRLRSSLLLPIRSFSACCVAARMRSTTG